jgi:DNA-binding NtrC family response regulator
MKDSKKHIQVVIVEDNPYYNRRLTKYVSTICSRDFYQDFEFSISSYFTAHECIEEMEEDVMLLDYFLFNEDEDDVLTGADVLEETKRFAPNCKVILLSGLKSTSRILQLKKEGIYDFVDKNLNSINRVGALLQTILKEQKPQRA